MSRELFHSLEVIKYATEEIRREKWSWDGMREAQKLRWRPGNLDDGLPRETGVSTWSDDRQNDRER